MRARRQADSSKLEFNAGPTARDLLLDLAQRLEEGGLPLATEDEYKVWIHAQQRTPGAIDFESAPVAIRRRRALQYVGLLSQKDTLVRLARLVASDQSEEAYARALLDLAEERRDLISEFKLDGFARPFGAVPAPASSDT